MCASTSFRDVCLITQSHARLHALTNALFCCWNISLFLLPLLPDLFLLFLHFSMPPHSSFPVPPHSSFLVPPHSSFPVSSLFLYFPVPPHSSLPVFAHSLFSVFAHFSLPVFPVYRLLSAESPDELEPTVQYKGSVSRPPIYEGDLDPIHFKLHAIEIHQFVPLPNQPSPPFVTALPNTPSVQDIAKCGDLFGPPPSGWADAGENPLR
eukprot:GHVT01045040.1.p1 GENE.GHVT01045040.1~~GHVT01045040.1.p1  ORF type:complete len:208 (-),score=35.20 GHVT01045040.1:285-908(-)